MYTIQRVSKKVLIEGQWKTCILWECMAKFGTHGATPMLLKHYPKAGVRTEGLTWVNYAGPWYSVYIENVREDGFVILYRM